MNARDESRTVSALAISYWEDVLRLNPIWATQVGDRRFDDQLPDLDPEASDGALATYRGAASAAAAIDRTTLTPVDRTTLDVIESHSTQQVERLELGYHLLEAVDHMWGPGTLLALLPQVQVVETAEQATTYRRRLADVPRYLAGAASLMLEGHARGITAPRIVVDRTISQVDRLLQQSPAESQAVLVTPEPEREATAEVIRTRVMPAYDLYRQALQRYREQARDTIGLSALPNGEALYASRARAWTSLDLAPAEVHELGRTTLESIRLEQQGIADKLGQPSVAEAIQVARERSRTSSRETIVRTARNQVERAWNASESWFGRRPATNCKVQAIDRSREADVLDHYIGPSEDGSRPGVFFVSTRPGRPLYGLASTVYHESTPGHHFQIALEQDASDRPMIRRFSADLVGGAFAEGWGLYAERLADEMGLFEDDAERLGMLELQALRAARLVIDTGIHAFEWSRDQSIAELERAWADSRADAETEIDRYIALPGQALAYTLGQMEIVRWRREAAERSGDSFSLSGFHDRLLEIGSLPLPAIGRELAMAEDAGRA